MNILHELFSFLIEKIYINVYNFPILKRCMVDIKKNPDIHVYQASTDKQDTCIWKESLRKYFISNFMI